MHSWIALSSGIWLEGTLLCYPHRVMIPCVTYIPQHDLLLQAPWNCDFEMKNEYSTRSSSHITWQEQWCNTIKKYSLRVTMVCIASSSRSYLELRTHKQGVTTPLHDDATIWDMQASDLTIKWYLILIVPFQQFLNLNRETRLFVSNLVLIVVSSHTQYPMIVSSGAIHHHKI